MRYPQTRYVSTDHANYLELHCWDGTCRGVLFVDVRSAETALNDIRAILDCDAIAKGFLPLGAYIVSRAAARKADELRAKTSDANVALVPEDIAAAVATLAATTDYVTEERDTLARALNPAGADHYKRLIDATIRTALEPHQ